MARKGSYYLGRVVKSGALETRHILQAIRNPEVVTKYGSSWTLINTKEYTDGASVYVFGRLAKYDPDGMISVVDPQNKTEYQQREPNLTLASSPFMYIPDYSGISFLHISNQIEYKTFMTRWAEVVNASHREILSSCDIDAIADLSTFSKKLKALDGIYKISATVSPPNPLFGPLWENLKEYLESRRSDKMKVEEDSKAGDSLLTDLSAHVEGVLDQTEEKPYNPGPLPIGDAAILMAADGYGKGYVKGKQNDEHITIRTSDTVKNFDFDREPDHFELYLKTKELLSNVKDERQMKHK